MQTSMITTIPAPSYKEIKNRKTLPCKKAFAHDVELCNFAHGPDDLLKKPCRNKTKDACIACGGFGEDCFYWHEDESNMDYWMRQKFDEICCVKSDKEDTPVSKVIHTNRLAPWVEHVIPSGHMIPSGHVMPHPYMFHPYPYVNGMMILNNQVPPLAKCDSTVVPTIVADENPKAEPTIEEKPEPTIEVKPLVSILPKESPKVDASVEMDEVKISPMKPKQSGNKVTLIFTKNDEDMEKTINSFVSLGFNVHVKFENN